jgi:general L-amino acid transport system substrate-binding protein
MLVVFASIRAEAAGPAQVATTLAHIRTRGALACGVVTQAEDWDKDPHGDLSALGSEICRAVAVAALGRDGLELHSFPAEADALRGLKSGEVDVLVGVTPSLSGGLQDAITFGPTVFWDSQTFMVHRRSHVTDAAALAGQTVCFIDGTDEGPVLLAAMRRRGLRIIPFPFQEEGEMAAGLVGGHCRAISAYASKLAGMRVQFHAVAPDFILLPDVLALSPVAIATRTGDVEWTALAGATVDVLLQADALGITQANLAVAHRDDDPAVQRLLGVDFSAGLALRLAPDWSARIIDRLGNYGEIFQRTVGMGSPLKLSRRLNAVCLQGGALCPDPVR